jgi:hypothetical protein
MSQKKKKRMTLKVYNRNKAIKTYHGGTRKRRKLAISDITKCNPLHSDNNNNNNKQRSTRCLPNSVYSSIKGLKGGATKNIFKAVGCNDNEEHCLLDKIQIDDDYKKELRKKYLRPRYPKSWLNDPDTWLDNYNISDVLKQYENAYNNFKFLGVFPIDFSAPNPYGNSSKCLYNELCALDLHKEMKKGIKKLAIIFNLDPHFKSGSHWVGLFIDISSNKNASCSYFDSYGYKTPVLIGRLMKSFKLQIPDMQLQYNARRFQYGNTECGMFSLYFIICMIHDIDFKDFCKDSVNDDFMLELRKVIFAK